MSTPVGDSTPSGRWYVPEPWDTPERQEQAIAHEQSLLRRRRRQRLLIAAILLAMLLIFLLAVTMALRGRQNDGGSSAASASPCPTQRVAKPSETTVRVLNATGRSGLAAQVAKTLKGRGYDVQTVSNAQTGDAGSLPALVIYGSGQEAQARAMGAQVTGAKLRSDSRSSHTVDLILGTSFKGLRTSQEAAGDLKQTDIPAGCSTGS